MLWQSALLAFVVALLCSRILLSGFGRRLVLDHPNERSLHERPVPRTGGLAIIAGAGISWVLWQPGLGLTLALAALLAAVSFVDDLMHLPTLVRLAAHLAVAVVALAYGIRFPGWLPFALLVLAVVWYENLYNFMDGADGLAGGMALIGFGAYAVAAQLSGAQPLATVSAVIAAASAAFLTKNFHPARIFLGDVGSVPLGLLAAMLGLVGWNDGLWPIWFPVLVFAPFVCDATLTLLQRLGRGERVWLAHREHYYQRLVRMGFGHRGTAYIEYAVMLACAATALGARNATAPVQIASLAAAACVLLTIAVWIDVRWARHRRQSPGGGA